jgi:hypothetical protein
MLLEYGCVLIAVAGSADRRCNAQRTRSCEVYCAPDTRIHVSLTFAVIYDGILSISSRSDL